MDRIRRLFGGKTKSSTEDSQQQNTDPRLQHTGLSHQSDTVEAVGNTQEVNTQDTGTKTALTKVGNLLRKVVPLKEGDCLECKLIGTTGCFAGAAYLLYHHQKLKNNYVGYRRTVWNVTVFTFAAFFVGIGVVRFFDIDMPMKTDLKRRTVAESGNKSNSSDT